MATDVLSDIDRNFLSDNMLDGDEWAYMAHSRMDELPDFVNMDVESSLSPEACFPDDLEIGILESEIKDDQWKELSDGSDSGIDALSMKPEPLSPSSFFSDTSSDFGVTSSTTDSVFPASAEMTQDDWDSIQSMLPDDLDAIKDELTSDVDLDLTTALDLPAGSTIDLESIDADSFPFTDYTTPTSAGLLAASPTQNIIAVPVTVRPAKLPIPVGAKLPLPGNKILINGNGKLPAGVVNQVLNTKVKIQPKPLNIAASSTTVQIGKTNIVSTTSAISNRPTVTVAALHSAPTATSVPQLTKLVPTPHTAASASSNHTNSLVDVKAVKRQQRMIKNRESACLSRKRKKDYMQSLEQQLQAYNSDNDRLRMENITLKRKIAVLQSENERLKRVLPTPKTAGVTVLMCVVFIISFNYLPSVPSFNSIGGPNVPDAVSIPMSAHTGRTLLSVQPDVKSPSTASGAPTPDDHRQMSVSAVGDGDKANVWRNVHDLVFGRHGDGTTLNGRYFCPTFFNSTESLRLVNELRGWVLGHEEELRRQQLQLEQAKTNTKPRKKYYPPRKLKAAMRGAALGRPGDLDAINKYEVQVFNGHDAQYENFLDAINRRNDTFYVVSFRRDHLLLPATAHNKTMRPRMSVMMPAVGLNETMQPPFGSIAMMQIDCEVTATRLVHIDKATVPHHLLNNTSSSSSHRRHVDDLHYESPGWTPPVGGGV